MEDTSTTSPQKPQVTELPKPEMVTKFDWFKNELAGQNGNLADLYHAGVRPEDNVIHPLDKYWDDASIRKPYEEAFGKQAKEKFTSDYNNSKKKLDAYTNTDFDIKAASVPTYFMNTGFTRRLEAAGKGMVSRAPSDGVVDFPKYVDPWGRKVIAYDYTTNTAELSNPEFGYREGAKNVLTPEGEYVSVEKYLEDNPGANLVHAVGPDGNPLTDEDNLNYLRPLKYGEERKSYEPVYTGEVANFFGGRGLVRPDWYAASWLPKNVMNFAADVLDSGSEILKLMDNLWQSGEQSDWDKGLSQFQNNVASVMYVPTSEEGMSKWYSTEGIVDSVAQIGGQLLGMMGIARGVSGLSQIAKLGQGTRAGSVAARAWMASISSDDFAKQAREAGLTSKEQAATFGMYFLGMYKIAGLSDILINPVTAKEMERGAINQIVKSVSAAKQASGGKLNLAGLYQAVKGGRSYLEEALRSAAISKNPAARVIGGGLTEGGEEMSEVFFDKSFKTGYNAIYGPYSGSKEYGELTNKDKDGRFKVGWDTLGTELAASLALGFLGGGLFKAVDIFSDGGKNRRENILSFGMQQNGYSRLRNRLNKMYEADQILPGGKKIDVFNNPTDNEEASRAKLVYRAAMNEIDMAEKLWKAYGVEKARAKTEESLSRITTNYDKVIGEGGFARYSSMGADITKKLNRVAELQNELAGGTTLTPEQTEERTKEFNRIQQELKDIGNGKYANRYLHEAIFNGNELTGFFSREAIKSSHRLDFEEFEKVNSYMKARFEDVNKINSLDPKSSLATVLAENKTISVEQASKLRDELNAKYEFDDFGNIQGTPEEINKYHQEDAAITRLVYGKSMSPHDDLQTTINADGSAGKSFKDIIETLNLELQQAEATGASIFDDVEKLDELDGQIDKRIAQAKGMLAVNSTINGLFEQGRMEERHPSMTEDEFKKSITSLFLSKASLKSLYEKALANKGNFFKSATRAAVQQRLFTGAVFGNINDAILKDGVFKDLGSENAADVAAVSSAEDPQVHDELVYKISKRIHEYFKSNREGAIQYFYDLYYKKLGSSDGISQDAASLMKAIIILDPEIFRNAYSKHLKSLDKDLRTPFPAQERNIYRIAASLTGGYNPVTSQTPETKGGRIFRPVFSESIFLRDEQGSGKTLVAAMGVAIAQITKGGKAVIFAKNEDVRAKNYEEFKKLGVNLDTSVNSAMDASGIEAYLSKSEKYTDVNYIVIDEATLYTAEELYNIDQKVKIINKGLSENQKIKILLMGDPMQSGAMHPDNPGSEYNIGTSFQGEYLDKTEMTRFSFRTGNLDIIELLKHLRTWTLHHNAVHRISPMTVKYNKKDKLGVMLTDSFDKTFADMIGKSIAKNSRDYVVISTDLNKLSELKQKYPDIPKDRFITPGQAQGRQWKYVFVYQPINNDLTNGDEDRMQYKELLTAAGRAIDMVVMYNDPSLKLQSAEGVSIGKSDAFTSEEFSQLRAERIQRLANIGATDMDSAPSNVERDLSGVKVEVKTKIEEAALDSIETSKWLNFVQNLRAKAGHENFLVHSFYTNGFTVGENGEREQLSSRDVQRIKRQIFIDEKLPLAANNVRFEMRLQKNEVPTLVHNLRSQQQNSELANENKIILFAKLMDGEKELAEVTVGGLTLDSFEMPVDEKKGDRVLSITYNQQQSNEILNALRADMQRASVSTVTPFSEDRSESDKQADKQSMKLSTFKKENPQFNYATGIWHVTSKSTRTPYLFYSSFLTQREIDSYLRTNQLSLSQLEPLLPGKKDASKELPEVSRTKLKELGILSIPLNGGKTVTLDDFAQGMIDEYRQKKKSADMEYVLNKSHRANLKNKLTSMLSLTEKEFKSKTYDEIEKKQYKEPHLKYLAELTKKWIRIPFDYSTKIKGEKIQKKQKRDSKGVVIKKLEKVLYPNKFIHDLFLTVRGEGNDKANAQRILDEFSKSIFKNGVYQRAKTVPDSTPNDRTTIFGLSDLTDELMSVPGYLAPEFPVFQIPSSMLTNLGENVVTKEIKVSKTVETFNEKPDVIVLSVEATKDETGDISLEAFNTALAQARDIATEENIASIAGFWFKEFPYYNYFSDFTRYFNKKLYDNLFALEGDNPAGIVTNTWLNSRIRNLKRSLAKFESHIDENSKSMSKAHFQKAMLMGANPKSREDYYDYVSSKFFDTLLRHYFPTIKQVGSDYVFVKKDIRYNPMAQSKDEVSHLELGGEMVRMHLFNTPLIEMSDGKLTSTRNLNKEDYVRVLRNMRDNDITSLDKAIAYFNGKGNFRTDAVKQSIYHRFLSPNPLQLADGRKLHSFYSVASDKNEQRVAVNTVTALLSFLSSGNESEYIRVLFKEDGTNSTTGRIVDIPLDYYRMDLESGIKAAYATYALKNEKNKTVFATHEMFKGGHRVTFNVRLGKNIRKVIVTSSTSENSIVEEKTKGIDKVLLSALFKQVGLGSISPNLITRFLTGPKSNQGTTSLIATLADIGQYLAQDNPDHKIFHASQLVYWPEVSDKIKDIKQIESAYGYNLMDGNKVNLMSLGFPYIHSKQRIAGIKNVPQSPLRSLEVVNGTLEFSSYMLKEGFITEDGNFFKHNSKMSVKESFEFDFQHLYLGFLSRNSTDKPTQSVAFSPISFSDKGSAGLVLADADFLMRGKSGINIDALRLRTLSSMFNYYRDLGYSVWKTWNEVLPSVGLTVGVTPDPTNHQDILFALSTINNLIPTLTAEQQAVLVKSNLVSQLHYTPLKGGKIGKLKNSLFTRINPDTLAQELDTSFEKFKTQTVIYNRETSPYLNDLKITMDEALASYFWNWNWVSHNFRSLWVGPEEQYSSKNSYSDMVKRASQVSTNRQRLITRDPSVPQSSPMYLYEGRKLNKTSKTAIISDFSYDTETISYTGSTSLKIFDGMSFHNPIAREQMKASYGGGDGMNVGANLKPISSYMNPLTGSSRYDKYASFEVSRQMRESGHPFVKAINHYMEASVPFTRDVTRSNGVAKNLAQLRQLMTEENPDVTDSQILDVMVENGVQDDYIHEVIFDSSVKTGVSNLNKFKSFDDLVNNLYEDDGQMLSYIERDNSERGLVLDASHDSDSSSSRLGSQFISTILQSRDTTQEAAEIVKAIYLLGAKGRAIINSANIDSMMKPVRDHLNQRNDVGMVQQVANQAVPFLDNKMLMSMAYGALSSKLTDEIIRFDVYGGQQVLSAATGVWLVGVDATTGQATLFRNDTPKKPGNGANKELRELKGFDAVNEVGQSIKESDEWKALKAAVESGDKILAKQLRAVLHEKLATEGWIVNVPEVVVSPTHFKAFGIPKGTDLDEITPEAFAIWDAENLYSNFKADWIKDEVTRQRYVNVRDTGDIDPERRKADLMAIAKPTVDEIIAKKVTDGVYVSKFGAFQKTLDIVVGRIPATTMHSLTPVKVIGFANDVDNTFYAHPDLLIFQGADQDIDKGNFLAYEPEEGDVVIPENLELSEKLTNAQLKNYIVKNIHTALTKPQSAIISTMPTGTSGIEKVIEELKIPEQDEFQTLFNPITNNEMFVRGQGGKSNVSIHAVGLKVYSAMVYSLNQSGKNYAFYSPESVELGRGGRTVGISNDLDALIAFDEFIQASVDNAKNPLLGRAKINQFNGDLVNALALHGYTPMEVIKFLNNPEVLQVYTRYEEGRDFSTKSREKLDGIIAEMVSKVPSPVLKDLQYFVGVAQHLTEIGRVLAINQEIPNNLFKANQLKNSFLKATGKNLNEFVNAGDSGRQSMAEQYNEDSQKINLMAVLNDNLHLLSYLHAFVKVDEIMKDNSKLYSDIMRLAQSFKDMNSEEKFESLVDFVQGLTIDGYINSMNQGAIFYMNGIPYDLRLVSSTSSAQGRLQFMRDFPNYMMSLEAVPGHESNIQDHLIENVYKDNLILKPQGNFREYSAEMKVNAMMSMKNVDKDLQSPTGDTLVSQMLGMYSLIKDKGGLSGTTFTEMFDYETSIFKNFDLWVKQKFSSDYLKPETTDEFKKQFFLFDYNYYPESKSFFGEMTQEQFEHMNALKREMRSNRLFIPYSNSITANDMLDPNGMMAPVTPKSQGWSPNTGTVPGAFNVTYKGTNEKESTPPINITVEIPGTKDKKKGKDKTKKQKFFEDDLKRTSLRWNVSPKILASFARRLGQATGVKVISTNTFEIAKNPDFADEAIALSKTKGFVRNGVIYINTDLMSIDTPMHEFGHVWMTGLEKSDPELFEQVNQESLNHPFAQTIRERYPELDERGVAEETFAHLLGMYNSDRVYSYLNMGFFARTKGIFEKVMAWLKKLFSSIFDTSISVKDSLADIIDKVGESMISALDMQSNDVMSLKILGVNMVSADPELSAIRERLKSQKRFEKIC